jgi:quinol monooxygenase YgiN
MTLIAMILSIVRIYPRPGIEQNILEVLESLKGPMSSLADFLGASIAVEVGENGAICYLERWGSHEALDRHLCSPLYVRVLEAMECSCRPPEVEFLEVTELGGLERVEKARIVH